MLPGLTFISLGGPQTHGHSGQAPTRRTRGVLAFYRVSPCSPCLRGEFSFFPCRIDLFARSIIDTMSPPAARVERMRMSKVRVLVGTRKGAFVLESDGKRERWDVSGPHFAGWELYHIKGSPVDPNRLYASQTSGWFGQVIQRSNDGGTTWEPAGNAFVYDGVPGTHQWYDGTPHPWAFARVWHLEPSLSDPDVVYAGVEDAALFRSSDGGQTWAELP